MLSKEDFQKYLKQKRRPNTVIRDDKHAKDPHCYYCGIVTVNDYPVRNRELKKGEEPPDDMATLEHLYHRFDKRRYDISVPDEDKKVVACYKCNVEKGKKDDMRLTAKQRKQIEENNKNRKKNQAKAWGYLEFIK